MTSMSRSCGNSLCSKLGKLHCDRCKNEFYCSQRCRKKSWKVHKLSCSENGTEERIESKSAGVCASQECSKAGNLSCSGCGTVGYCSAECQKKDRKQHEVNCKKTAPTGQDRATADQKPSSSDSRCKTRPAVNPTRQVQDEMMENPFMRQFMLVVFMVLAIDFMF